MCVCVYIYTYTCMYVYVYICGVCVCVYIYIQTSKKSGSRGSNSVNQGTVYQSPIKQGKTKVLKTSVWTDTVLNYIRQKSGEIEAFKTLEVGALKCCKEHVPRDGNDWTEEGQMLLDDPELWLGRQTFSWECHASRKRDRTKEDGTFLLHKKGVIPSTFTGDWLLTEDESRDKVGEWLKKTQVRYQD